MRKVCEEQKRPWHGLQPAIGGATHGLIVLDIDSEKGYAEWAAIQAKHGAAPTTLTTASGRCINDQGLRGAHIAFAIPAGLDPEKHKRLTIWGGGNLDGRANGKGWVVLPPSLHRSGHRYVITCDAPIAEAPGWLVDYSLDCIAKAKGRKRLDAAKKKQDQKAPAPSFDLEPTPPPGTWMHDWAYGVIWKPTNDNDRKLLLSALNAADPDFAKCLNNRPSIDRQTWLGILWSLRAHERFHRDQFALKLALAWSRQFASHTDESFWRTVWNREPDAGQPHVGFRRLFDLADQNTPGWRAAFVTRRVDAVNSEGYLKQASDGIGAAGAIPEGTGAAALGGSVPPAQPFAPMGGMGSGGMGGGTGGNGPATPPPSPGNGPILTLSRQQPSKSADIFHKTFAPNMLRANDEFLVWRDGAYVQVEDNEVQSQIQAMLDRAKTKVKDAESGEMINVDFDPKSKDVAEVLAALKNKLHRSALDRPQWLPGYTGPDAANLVSFPNVLLDTTNGKTYDPTPGLFTRNVLGFNYDAKAKKVDEWLKFLRSIFAEEEREEKIRLLRQIMGYLISGDISYQKIFMLVGPARSGKGTIMQVINRLIGQSNIYSTSFTRMVQRFGTEGFIGQSMVVFPDAHTGQWIDHEAAVETLKSISGCDPQSIDRKYEKSWKGVLGVRFMINANAMPNFADASGAFALRFVTIQTDISYADREDLRLFEDKIQPEIPAIMNWALAGLADLRAEGRFTLTENAKQARETMDVANNPVKAFANEKLVFEPGARVSKKELYDAYRVWCSENGQRESTSIAFSKKLYTVSQGALKGLGVSTIKTDNSEGKRVDAFEGVRFAT
jgi:putative DNA primase/helicase